MIDVSNFKIKVEVNINLKQKLQEVKSEDSPYPQKTI